MVKLLTAERDLNLLPGRDVRGRRLEDGGGVNIEVLEYSHLHEEERLAGDGVPELLGVLGIVSPHGDNLLAETGEFYQVGHFNGTMKRDWIETGQTS